MRLITLIFFLLVFAGCSTIEKTTKTEKKPFTIPGKIVNDTVYKPIYLPFAPHIIDSIGREYLKKYCKGSGTVDKDGLRSKFEFQVEVLKDSLDEAGQLILKLTTELEQKKQDVPGEIETTSSEEIPSGWWIWKNSLDYQAFAYILGAVSIIILALLMKTKLKALL